MSDLVPVETEELIIVKQLPIIEDRLDSAFAAVQDRLSAMAGLAVTEENYKEIKKTRAELNKELGEFESMRKKVKQAIEAPYKSFESGAYKRLADAYKSAIESLDGEIKDVEGGLKRQRQEELFTYYEDYRKSLGLSLDFADARRSNIKVGLSGSMKGLKDQAREWLDKIDGDLKMIETLDNRDEVLAEYRILLSVTDAVRVVADRAKRVEEERKRREAEEEAKLEKERHIAEVEAAISSEDGEKSSEIDSDVQGGVLASPTVGVAEEQFNEPDEQILCARYLGYEIFGTLSQLKKMKQVMVDTMLEFCESEGMNYGQFDKTEG